MAQTPNPSLSDMRTMLPLVTGRPSVAVFEVIRRLEQNLPRLIDDINSELSLSESRKIVQPAKYMWAPVDLSDQYINTVLVGLAITTLPQGITGAFRNEVQLVIYTIGERVVIADQVAECFDRAALIQGALFAFLTGCYDAQDRFCWKTLEPTGITFLPEAWAEYSGASVTYKLDQVPYSDNWK